MPVSLPLHDRSFDLVLLSNWEDQIIYEPEEYMSPVEPVHTDLTTPVNKALDSGAWTQSIIWSPRAPFRDFTQLELNSGEDAVSEERVASMRSFIQSSDVSDLAFQPKIHGQESASGLIMLRRKISSTFQMIISMRLRRKVDAIGFAKRLANLLSSMLTLHRNSNCPS